MAPQAKDTPNTRMSGLRVLVVEDEALLVMMIEDMLAELKCELIGPAGRVTTGVELAGSKPLDGALLDVNVAGMEVFPVAAQLRARGIPFIFVSGYGPGVLPEEWRDRPILRKPFAFSDLAGCMEKIFAAPLHP